MYMIVTKGTEYVERGMEAYEHNLACALMQTAVSHITESIGGSLLGEPRSCSATRGWVDVIPNSDALTPSPRCAHSAGTPRESTRQYYPPHNTVLRGLCRREPAIIVSISTIFSSPTRSRRMELRVSVRLRSKKARGPRQFHSGEPLTHGPHPHCS